MLLKVNQLHWYNSSGSCCCSQGKNLVRMCNALYQVQSEETAQCTDRWKWEEKLIFHVQFWTLSDVLLHFLKGVSSRKVKHVSVAEIYSPWKYWSSLEIREKFFRGQWCHEVMFSDAQMLGLNIRLLPVKVLFKISFLTKETNLLTS